MKPDLERIARETAQRIEAWGDYSDFRERAADEIVTALHRAVEEAVGEERRKILDFLERRIMVGRECLAETPSVAIELAVREAEAIVVVLRSSQAVRTPCEHKFEANPGMTDSLLRYCAKCGIWEGAIRSSGGEGER